MVAVSMLAFSTFYWQYVQQDHYNQVLLNRMQREWERFNERVQITDVGYGSYLRFKVGNVGSVTAHVITVYLNDTTTNVFRDLILANYICSDSSAYISPDSERWICTNIPLTAGDTYDLRIATERGNMGLTSKFTQSQNPLPGGSQSMPLVFGWGYNDFQYYTGSEWKVAWKLPTSGIQKFKIRLTNTYDKTVILKGTDSRLAIILDDFQSSNSQYAYLTGDQTLLPNQPTDIYFGSLQNNLSGSRHYYVFVEIFYKLEGSEDLMGTTVGVLAVLT
jgi:hypothetical protein